MNLGLLMFASRSCRLRARYCATVSSPSASIGIHNICNWISAYDSSIGASPPASKAFSSSGPKSGAFSSSGPNSGAFSSSSPKSGAFSSSSSPNSGAFSSSSSPIGPSSPKSKAVKKRIMFKKLSETQGTTAVEETLELFRKEDETAFTKSDLVRWAKLLYKKGKIHHAAQVFDWMQRKNLPFSRFETALYVDLLVKTKGSNPRLFHTSTDVSEPVLQNTVSEAMATITPSIVKIFNFNGKHWSGTIFTSDGLIWTCAEMFSKNQDTVNVQMHDGETCEAGIVFVDYNVNIAMIKIKTQNLRPMKFGPSCLFRQGHFVIVVGLSSDECVPNLSFGIISHNARPYKGKVKNLPFEKSLRMLQFDCDINSENLGGPLVDMNGKVVGIVTSKYKESEGIGFAIANDSFVDVMKFHLEGKGLLFGEAK